MSRDEWPPGRNGEGGPSSPETPAAVEEQSASSTSPQLHANRAHRQCRHNTVGRHADAWRDGFGCGFRDALRLAQREIDDPAVWAVLDRLAANYELAGDS
jgi:hypothetical protein